MFEQACKTFCELQSNWVSQTGAQFIEEEKSTIEHQKRFIEDEINRVCDKDIQKRVRSEFFGYGPLESLIEDHQVTEILVNHPTSVWYEKGGCLEKLNDHFFSELSYENILERICQSSGRFLSLNHPYVESKFLNFRLTLVDRSLSGHHLLSLRRHPENPWTFDRLVRQGWCTDSQKQGLELILREKKNFLVIGATGSGKTSVTNAFLASLESSERAIIIEDCAELAIPNDSSVRLLTRDDPYQQLSEVSQQDLIRRSLRLRPDRLVMGEIRGPEAKDFLLMISTGHEGSLGTLHAKTPQEALIRLEMLIQLGAPQWKLEAIRKLISLSLNYIVVTERGLAGQRRLQNIYKLMSLEDSGFTLEPLEV
jgi:pilus assembly protein CpaF